MITTVRRAVINQAVIPEAAVTLEEAAIPVAAAIQAAEVHLILPSVLVHHMADHQEEPVQEEDTNILIMIKIYKGPVQLVLYFALKYFVQEVFHTLILGLVEDVIRCTGFQHFSVFQEYYSV